MAAPAAADRTAELQAHPNAPGVRPPDPGICPTTVHNVKDDRVAPLLPPAAITHCWLVDQQRCVLRRPAAATPSTGARIGPPPHRAGPRDRRPRQCSRLLPTAACPALMCPYSTNWRLPRRASRPGWAAGDDGGCPFFCVGGVGASREDGLRSGS